MTLDFGYFNGGERFMPLSEIGFRIKKNQTKSELNKAKQLFVSSNRSMNNGGARTYYTNIEWSKFSTILFKAILPQEYPKILPQSKNNDDCALVQLSKNF
jgi:hypothetical protein